MSTTYGIIETGSISSGVDTYPDYHDVSHTIYDTKTLGITCTSPIIMEEEWIGRIKLQTDDVKVKFTFRAILQFWSGCLSGVGKISNVYLQNKNLNITGVHQQEKLYMDIWIDCISDIGRPLACECSIDIKKQRIDGSCTIACLSPDECGCSGAQGTVKMRRIRFQTHNQ